MTTTMVREPEAESPERAQPLSRSTVFLLTQEWDWRALRDYVVLGIEREHGAFHRDAAKEFGIFSGFIRRWGADKAQSIARYAVDDCRCVWRGRPLQIGKFSKPGDEAFANIISGLIS